MRKGWTTGACAAAAARAAFAGLITGACPATVRVVLPHDVTAGFAVHRARVEGSGATASVIKDAGDDADITHGAEIVATVEPGPPGSGITFRAGPGVGTVTRPGLPMAVGEPAITPGPRAIIGVNLRALATEHGREADLVVTIAIPDGERLAPETLNGRLGIVGGLSILGTTGVVVPYSRSAWVATIHRCVTMARACGITHVGAATGRTSEAAVRRLHGLADPAMIDMGDFAGALLRSLRHQPVPRLTIGGGFAKLVKLGQGSLDLHSAHSRVDMTWLAALTAGCGADSGLVAAVTAATSAAHALDLATARAVPLGPAVARAARETALAALGETTDMAVDVLVVDRLGRTVGHAGP
ncbi:MAG: cobalt-precorrin-5B (C(1))-methyltransferase [Alphaproteobacteria bacterium]